VREILFRGKRIDNGEWVCGLPTRQPANVNTINAILCGGYFDNDFGTVCGHYEKVDPATISQYTGLSDKNGKKIFEGDIISLVNADYEEIKVVCDFGTARREIYGNLVDIVGFYFKLPNGKKSFPIVSNYLGKHDLEIFEVTGNIHDNPELLTVTP